MPKTRSIFARERWILASGATLIIIVLYSWFFLKDVSNELCVVSGQMRKRVLIAGIPVYQTNLKSDFAQLASVNQSHHLWMPTSVVSIRIHGRTVSDTKWARIVIQMRLLICDWDEKGYDEVQQKELARSYLSDLTQNGVADSRCRADLNER
jgi:hypothetical protein